MHNVRLRPRERYGKTKELDIERDEDLTPTARLDVLGAKRRFPTSRRTLNMNSKSICQTTPRSSSPMLRAFTTTCENNWD